MAKQTLLEMVQDIMSGMSSDNVNSIDDTTEAGQVATIVKESYLELMADRDWPHLMKMFKLTSLADSSYPTTMQIPSTCADIKWIKYNKKESVSDADLYSDVTWLDPEKFINLVNNRNSTDSNVTQYNEYISGVPLNIITDNHPTYWTSFDDEYIVFDSIYSSLDTTLQESKTQVWGKQNTTWTHSDSAYPDMPDKMFPMLLAEAKALAFIDLRQIEHRKEELKSRRQQNSMQHQATRVHKTPQRIAYGRKKAR